MQQLELFDGLQPVQKWLHVWTEAERERNKKATIGPPGNDGGEEVMLLDACTSCAEPSSAAPACPPSAFRT